MIVRVRYVALVSEIHSWWPVIDRPRILKTYWYVNDIHMIVRVCVRVLLQIRLWKIWKSKTTQTFFKSWATYNDFGSSSFSSKTRCLFPSKWKKSSMFISAKSVSIIVWKPFSSSYRSRRGKVVSEIAIIC